MVKLANVFDDGHSVTSECQQSCVCWGLFDGGFYRGLRIRILVNHLNKVKANSHQIRIAVIIYYWFPYKLLFCQDGCRV